MTPAARIQARAVELFDGVLGLATDATSYPGKVLVGVAVPGAVVVLQLPEPVDQMEILRMAGFTLAAPAQPTALERARVAKGAARG